MRPIPRNERNEATGRITRKSIEKMSLQQKKLRKVYMSVIGIDVVQIKGNLGRRKSKICQFEFSSG